MSRYLIQSSHAKEECLKALDEVLAKGASALNKFEWGCVAGDHTGYAIVDVENEGKARELVPAFLRGKARVVQLGKFSPEQIRSFHKAA
ncbi:MAG: hypothetical protein HY894_09160 [Deltaproteobacteria bacterium]|nr:hypothetical protein [Deltaproteobacteria bacterium]